ncbi:radical SAM protein [bacterium]|nr:radical SAM protein [bacterium]
MLNKVTKIKQNTYLFLVKKALDNKTGRKIILNQFDKKICKLGKGSEIQLEAVRLRKCQWAKASVKQLLKNYEKGYISRHVTEKMLEVLGLNNFFRDDLLEIKKIKKSFKDKYEVEPPLFILISPTQVCNLKCKGCYASSSPETGVTMPFDIFDRILKENHNIFGSRFVVISGGEPMMYKSQEKTILDVFEKYNDTFFIFYTNGTLITKEVAGRLAKSGNAYPQISVEGFEKETDERRGKGIFQRVLKSMEYLREAGVPFSVSVTGTRKNINALLSNEFYDFWFEKQGASYMWQFQLMPIGRGKKVFDQMPTPEERVKLYRKWEQLLEKGYPIADFWNSAVLSNGCIAYGRPRGGYFYIDWNGNIMPCVFVPYYADNIYDLYKQGKTIAGALTSDFFRRGREWQKKYGFACQKEAENWLMPCSIRDNYKNFMENIITKETKGEDDLAEETRNSKEYYEGFIEYDKKLKKLTQPIWDKEYRNASNK